MLKGLSIFISSVHEFLDVIMFRTSTVDMLYLTRKIREKGSYKQDRNRTHIFQYPVGCSTRKLPDYLLSYIVATRRYSKALKQIDQDINDPINLSLSFAVRVHAVTLS